MAIEKAFMVPHPPLIIHEIGKGREKDVQKTVDSYLKVAEEIEKIKPETIIISSPHTVMYSDYFHLSSKEKIEGSFANFGVKEVSFEEYVDLELVEEIENIAKEMNFPTGKLNDNQELDHGSMVPLYFIRKYYQNCKIVIVGLSGLNFSKHYQIGQIIKRAVNKLNRKVVYIASGDLSHKLQTYGPYGFIKEGPIYDEKIMEVMGQADFLNLLEFDPIIRERASECGHRSFIMMAGALDGTEVKTEKLSHEDTTGVGYGICIYTPIKENKERCFLNKYLMACEEKIKKNHEDKYISLARKTINQYIKNKEIIKVPEGLPKEMLEEQAGVFVSIHEENNLRGCIGTIQPLTNCIAEEIIRNAISASTQDRRFTPITEEELPYLEISVDVLKSPEDISSMDDLDVKKYGVIVTSGMKRGLLLPNLEGIDTIEEQVRIAKRKGNILDSDEISLQRFEVIRHK